MTETTNEETVVEETTTSFTDEQNREIAYRSDANPAVAAGSCAIAGPVGAAGFVWPVAAVGTPSQSVM